MAITLPLGVTTIKSTNSLHVGSVRALEGWAPLEAVEVQSVGRDLVPLSNCLH